MHGKSIMTKKRKKEKKITSHAISSRECEGSALNQHSLLRAVGSQGGRGGGLSCQSHISAPKPQRLSKVELPETGRSVTISPELALPSSFSFGEAQAQLKHTTESFKHLQPLDMVRRGEMSRARSRSRARLSVAPGFQELGGLPGTPSTGRGGYLGQRHRRPGAGSRRASREPHQPPAARGRLPAQVKRLLPAARAPLPSSLWPPGPCLCVKGVPLPSRISRPGSPGLRLRGGYWGGPAGTPAPLPEPLARRRQTSAAQSAAASLQRGSGNKEAQAANGSGAAPASRQSPSAAPHAPSRPELVAGKVRGGVAFW